jgi:hypothetical protein
VYSGELMLAIATQRAQSCLHCLSIFSLSLLHLVQLIDNDAKLLMIARYLICNHEIFTTTNTTATASTIATSTTTKRDKFINDKLILIPVHLEDDLLYWVPINGMDSSDSEGRPCCFHSLHDFL